MTQWNILWHAHLKPIFAVSIFLYYLSPNVPGIAESLWTLGMYLAGLFILLMQWEKLFWLISRDLWLVAILTLDCLGITWSIHPSLTFSAIRALILITILGAYIALNHPLDQQLRLLVFALGISAVFSLIAMLVPSYGFKGLNFQGIFKHKNRLSIAMAMSTVLFLDLYLHNKIFRIFRNNKIFQPIALVFAISSFILLILSNGKGGYVVLALPLTLLPLMNAILQNGYKSKLFRLLLWIYAIIFVVSFLVLGLNYIVVDLLGKDLTLNSRTELWDYLIQRGMTRPWFGFGVGAFWPDPEEGRGVFYAFPWFTVAAQGGGNAHSGYIDYFLQRGFFGCVLLGFYTLLLLWKISKVLFQTQRVEFFWALQVLVATVVVSFYETDILSINSKNWGWLFLISVSLSISLLQERNKRSESYYTQVALKNNPYIRGT